MLKHLGEITGMPANQREEINRMEREEREKMERQRKYVYTYRQKKDGLGHI